jgi:hypothetical protein
MENRVTFRDNPLFRTGKHTLQVISIKIHNDAIFVIENVPDQPMLRH